MESGFLGMFRWLEMFMADCLASDLTSVFMVDKRKAPDICSSTHKGGSTPKKKKRQITPCQKEEQSQSFSTTDMKSESRAFQPLVLSFITLIVVQQRTLMENTLRTEDHNVCFSRLTDDGQLGWMVDGCHQQPYGAASVCMCVRERVHQK